MTRIRGDDLIAIGLEQGPVFGVALGALPKAVKRLGREQALAELQLVVAAPEEHLKAAASASPGSRCSRCSIARA
jgi:hypothetical protein